MPQSNRPLTPVELPEPVQFTSAFTLYEKLINTGLTSDQSYYGLETGVANDPGYCSCLSVSGSGALLILMIGALNVGAVSRNFGARITFDGNIVLERNNYPIAAGDYGSLVIVGQAFLGVGEDEILGIESDYLPFDTQLLIEVWNDEPSDMGIVPAWDLYLT